MRDELKGHKAAFFGLPLDTRRRRLVCADIALTLRKGTATAGQACFRHQCLNATKLPAALRDDRLFAALSRADCLSADGMGIVWAARLLGIKVAERVTGIDLMTDLLAQFAQDGTRVFLLGARQDVLDQLQGTLPARFPGLIIVGTHHGYEPDDEKLADCVAQAKPDALFVALPSPRKELFVDQYSAKTGCRFAMGVGGAFDVLAGNVRRAPVIWQRCGLEFLWRIFCQPRYMIPRYGRGLWAFARLVVPRIVRFQIRRIWRALQKAATISVIFMMLTTAADLQAQPTTPATFDLENRQAAISWIEAEIAKVEATEDVAKLIDALVGALLSEDGTNQQSDIDWQVAEDSLKVLLGLFDVVLGGGSSRFLLETVLGGVVLRLLDLHPEPGRLSEIIRGNSSDLAERLFERNANQATIFVGEQQSFAASIEPEVAPRVVGSERPPETERVLRYSLLFVGGPRNPVVDSYWGIEDYQEPIGIPELEDASPR
ncbi:WecB/TagA/CpsF family glycosyltransferase [Thalassospira profundimaris]|uniref:WecB/TagA/CpsF family glycosyltransferase n=1 Tax=Thalassospira profundimaris TaxID=502049 RepID=UPI0002871F84|nr:WecB/TagA/CpsF family glycosyltransferase [Thalassospira profundimaris]EKF08406.1 N-acetylmannosaminyltransferase [Thalassospira profundimaris WP0211]